MLSVLVHLSKAPNVAAASLTVESDGGLERCRET